MIEPHYTDDLVTLYHGDCLDVLHELPDASVDAVVTDPPYGLEFMGKDWDAPWRAESGDVITDPADVGGFQDGNGGNPFSRSRIRYGREGGDMLGFQAWCELWAAECLRVLKPGGHLLAFGGTRTWHRLACAIEDAGFEVRDSIAWMYGQGFPKSLNVSERLGDRRCRCEAVPYTHDERAESPTERDVRPVPDTDVSATVDAGAQRGQVLLAGMSEQGAPAAGRAELSADEDGRSESGMEGRRDLSQGQGQLHRPEVRALSDRPAEHGAQGRLRNGASTGHGPLGGAPTTEVGSGQSHQPRPEGQQAGEPGAVPVERGSQAWRGWPVCERCDKPVIPDGLGTAAKPAHEPVVVARRPLIGTVAANVLAHGTGALNIDGCRVGTEPLTYGGPEPERGTSQSIGAFAGNRDVVTTTGRWPANVVLDEYAAAVLDEQSGETSFNPAGAFGVQRDDAADNEIYGKLTNPGAPIFGYGDRGGASRFFYTAKASGDERPRVDGIAHPTVKPLDLMRWLVRLVTPPGGVVLEPFAGSGTTLEACVIEGFHAIGIEREADYIKLIEARLTKPIQPDMFGGVA